jgi:DHA1 family tetracycline resistance protein-like MFS transporter
VQTELQQETTLESGSAKKRGLGLQTLIFMMVTALLSSIGFGIISPVVPFLVRPYVSPENTAITLGWLVSSYALCQMFAAPVLGALSDVWGRRWLLLLCLFGSAIGYVLLGIGGALWILFLGRIIDGITGGNFSILSAYIADVTKPEERGRYFGIFGAMIGVGFIIGPVLGGLLAKISYSAPLYAAAGITLFNVLLGLFALPESLSKEQRAQAKIDISTFNPLYQFLRMFRVKQIMWMLVASFCYALPFSALMGGLNGLLAIDELGWAPEQIGYTMLGVGILDIIMQGFLSGFLLKRFSETTLTIGGFVCVAGAYVSLALISVFHSSISIFVMIALWGIGSGLLEPASRGLLSRLTPDEDQGVVMGGSQSIQSLTMVVGPLIAGFAYSTLGHGIPFWVGAAIFLLGIVAVGFAIPTIRKAPKSEGAEAYGH